MFKNVQRFYKFLSNHRKKQINFLFITLFFGGIFESFVIYISLPFIYIITNRNELNNIPYVGNLFNQMNIFESQEILKYTSIFFTLIIIISALFKLLNQWFMYRLSAAICSDYSTKVYWNIINTPYEDHITRNTSEIIANLNIQVEQALYPSIIIYFQIIFIITNIIFILGSLLIVNYWLAIISFSLLFLVYIFLSSTTKKRLIQNSKTVSASEIKLVRNVQEGLGFLKEIIMSGNAILFTKDFASTDRNKRYKQSEAQFIFSSPKYILEGLALLFFCGISISIIFFFNNSQYEFAYIGALAISMQKLLPFVNNFFTSISKIRVVSTQTNNIYNLLKENKPSEYDYSNIKKLSFNNSIKIKDIYFKYNDNEGFILNGINLNIKKGQKIGIIGETGSGKSTLLNIISGLLKPHKGDIYVDDKNLYKDSKKLIKSWRKGVSLVSQDIYLLDKSIKENISLTNDPNLINNKKLNKVLSLAELNKFKKKLKRGVDSKVGERGIWLSGGQKQRIGIARGFYKDSNLIILDEATSALDENTQKKILSNLNREFKDKTIIMISHRLSTLKICDEIYEIKNGKLNVVDIDKILMK